MPLPPRQTIPVKGVNARNTSEDARFSNFETDPKFRLPSKKHKKTKLDARFARLQSDPDFHSKASVDRYGRALENKSGKKAIEKLYHVEDEDKNENENEHESEGYRIVNAKRDRAVLKELQRVEKQGFDPIRDGGLDSSSDESSSDEEEEIEVQGLAELAGESSLVPTGEITSRLAAVNLDWDNIRAADILAVVTSFAPVDGSVHGVAIYPSEFGIERLQREEIEGPPRQIFASAAGLRKEATTLSADPPNASDLEHQAQPNLDLHSADHGEEFDSTALRNYQLDRLRYYYAVITCSSSSAAKAIYDNLDGQEYLTSANFFDLRFVPDGITFDQDIHDECTKLPHDYKPNEFTTGALTHSKVTLTWDADDTTRKEVQKRAFSRRELNKNELQAYLGTDSSSSEDENDTVKENKAASFRKALGLEVSSQKVKSGRKGKATAKRDRDFPKPEGDMEITFNGGLLNDSHEGPVFENEIPLQETTVEKYVRKERERKSKRKQNAQAKKEVERPPSSPTAHAEENDPFNDPFFASDPEEAIKASKQDRKSKKAAKRAERDELHKATTAERENLELLMANDDDSKMRHFDMKEVVQTEKAKRKGQNKAPKADDGFQINTIDPRFAKLYESHEFAIDPTNPRFKETAGMKALLEESRKKRKHDKFGNASEDGGGFKRSKKQDPAANQEDGIKLAARVKAKSKHK